MTSSSSQTSRLNLTYLALRRNLGILGILLPIILVLGNRFQVEPSISHYYYTDMSVVFTGILIAFGLFLFSYRGYPKEDEVISDDWLTNLAGVLIILTAYFPTSCAGCPLLPRGHEDELIGNFHLICAGLFLAIMGWMSYFRFTKGETTDQIKKRRKPIYYACGFIIWLSLVLLIIDIGFRLNITGKDVFILETIAVVFFGIAWLIKGEALKRYGL